MPVKEWRVAPYPPQGFAESIGFPAFQAHLLYNRGLHTRSEARSFIAAAPDMEHDPMLLSDMGAAVQRLQQAIASGETIGVYGDFDADGVTGTAVLVLGLREVGASVVPYIPDRADEGHGMNSDAIEFLHAGGVSLLITVDCGITDFEPVSQAGSLGIDTIITDHHAPLPTLPNAIATIHADLEASEYPFPSLTGVGMGYKVVSALWHAMGKEAPEHLLELVALGTVADVGPMIGENRYYVKRGLERINNSRNAGVRALILSAGLAAGSIDEESLSFGLIPRLNAAGRMGRAGTSLDLLTTKSRSEAGQLAAELEYLNRERRELTRRHMSDAYDQVQAGAGDEPGVIIVGQAGWEPGLIGLIAGQLSEEFARPAIAVSIGDTVSRASARSVPGVDIIECLRAHESRLLRMGGHSLAAGFSVNTADLPRLRQDLSAYLADRLQGQPPAPTIDIDCELTPSAAWGANMKFMQDLAPFGSKNPQPIFIARDAGVVEARLVGADRSHLKMQVAHEGQIHDAIAFRMGNRINEADGRIDVVYAAGVDEWRGRKRLQLMVQDFAPAGK